MFFLEGNILIIVTQVVMGVILTGFILLPWIRPRVNSSPSGPSQREPFKEPKKEAILDTLQDLEYDHETGKINDRDYRRLRERYLNRAMELMEEDELEETSLPEKQARKDPLEEEITTVREGLDDNEGETKNSD